MIKEIKGIKDVEKKVKGIISESLSADESALSLETGPGDIPQWDSLGHQVVLSSVEKFFNIAFSIDEALDIETIEDLVEITASRIGK